MEVTPKMVEAGARALNLAGWTAEDGTHEPGEWCKDCQHVCRPVARAVLEAALGEKSE